MIDHDVHYKCAGQGGQFPAHPAFTGRMASLGLAAVIGTSDTSLKVY